MAILVTGGAGYIGSHTVRYLKNKGIEVVVVDNLVTGHRESIGNTKFYEADLRNEEKMDIIFRENEITGIIHFAALSIVGDSMEDADAYYNNNVYGMICLLSMCKKYGVKNIVFSSSAATYGIPETIPITEEDPAKPINTYGQTKLTMEEMCHWYDVSYGIKYVALRYFNAAGAASEGDIGEDHSPESHLIPLILQVPLGKRDKIYIFGNDYDTKDGTCIRDYIHVEDLASAHYLALKYLEEGNESNLFNLGNNIGYSVKEVIECTKKVTGEQIPVEISDRRSGDPAILIASSDKAKQVLGWKPHFDSLETIINSAWNWHKNNPTGFKKDN